jgi:LacI family transcriptional regulator
MDRVNLIAIARKLGLSKMSVSRALKGARGVSEATRAQVRAVAEEFGYAPDPAISAAMARMRSRKHADLETIAWLSTHGAPGAWKDNFLVSEVHLGATEQAARMGYRIEEFCLNQPGMTPKRVGGILYNRSIRGVIVAPLREHGPIEGFPWQHFSAVCCGHSLLSPALHRVSADQFQVIQVAWQSLTQRGYKRIGLFASESDNSRVDNLWLSSLLGWQHNIPRDSVVPPMITDDWNAQTFMKWFTRHKPDVVLSFPVAYEWMKKAGIRVPQQCGFALLNFDESQTLAGVDHRIRHLGAAAVSFVAGELSSNQYGIPDVRKSLSSECVWRDAPTVRRTLKRELVTRS